MRIPQKIVCAVFALITTTVYSQECTSPNGFSGQCVPIYDCEPVYNFLRSTINRPMTLEERQFIGRLQCHQYQSQTRYFCCAKNDPNFISLLIKNGTIVSLEQRFSDSSELPTVEKYECGVDFLANRVFGGSNTELNEFPWMALLQYIKPNGQVDFGCGGSLINQRYVLTAAHCVVGDVLLVKGQLINIRFGEYNLDTFIDCEETEEFGLICAPPVLDVPVESTKAHSDYSRTSYDIGLVRLAYSIPEVSNIYPICLPPSLFTSPIGRYYVIAGWGKTSTAKKSSVLQKLFVPLYDIENCQYLFPQVQLTDRQLCAGGENGKDSCTGDSGGPLMTDYNGVWIAEGIVSFGLSTCGQNGVPGIYTRVSRYIDWIRANLEP